MTKVKLAQSKKFLKYLELNPVIHKYEKSNSKYKNFNTPDQLEDTGNRSYLCEGKARGADLDDIVDIAFPECCRVEMSKQECRRLLKKTYDQATFLYFQGKETVSYK